MKKEKEMKKKVGFASSVKFKKPAEASMMCTIDEEPFSHF